VAVQVAADMVVVVVVADYYKAQHHLWSLDHHLL
jgi:hypothetical protein